MKTHHAIAVKINTYERLIRRKLCGTESMDSVVSRIMNNEKVHPK